jgi:hypothetical protein
MFMIHVNMREAANTEGVSDYVFNAAISNLSSDHSILLFKPLEQLCLKLLIGKGDILTYLLAMAKG